jgi:CHAD domain-containing protein
MARARKSLEAAPIDPQIWLAQILRKRFDKIVELHSAPLEHPRGEGVHDMRVSIRRLRSALRDFAQLTDKFPLKKIRTKLKALADLLGEVRDLDVAIDAFTKASKDAKGSNIKKGIAEIVKDCKTQRREAYDRLREHLVRQDLADLNRQFDRAFDQSLRQREMFAARGVNEAARAVIENRLDRFLRNIDALYDPFAVRRIHRLRIAGKHLRYSIELFGDLWNEDLGPFADETKKMQSYLGDLHDRDFWIAGSSKRISAERPRSKREEMIYQARIWLLSEFTRQRMNAYRHALETWSDWRGNDFPGRLRKAMADGSGAKEEKD